MRRVARTARKRTLNALLVLLVELVEESQTLLQEGGVLADFDFTSDASRSLNILLSTLNQTIRFVTTQRGEICNPTPLTLLFSRHAHPIIQLLSFSKQLIDGRRQPRLFGAYRGLLGPVLQSHPFSAIICAFFMPSSDDCKSAFAKDNTVFPPISCEYTPLHLSLHPPPLRNT